MKTKTLIHYSRFGYEGKYSYNSACGKVLKTHQDNEDYSIHPEEVNCKQCMSSETFISDLNDVINTPEGVKRRLYIESDILHANEFRNAQTEVENFANKNGEKYTNRIFSEVLDMAWHDLEKTWSAVKRADEIYATSSLVPLYNGYAGAPVIFNGMCERAIKENITGKKVIILNELRFISWGMIKIDLMKKAFKNNSLYMYNADSDLEAIDISSIKK